MDRSLSMKKPSSSKWRPLAVAIITIVRPVEKVAMASHILIVINNFK